LRIKSSTSGSKFDFPTTNKHPKPETLEIFFKQGRISGIEKTLQIERRLQNVSLKTRGNPKFVSQELV